MSKSNSLSFAISLLIAQGIKTAPRVEFTDKQCPAPSWSKWHLVLFSLVAKKLGAILFTQTCWAWLAIPWVPDSRSRSACALQRARPSASALDACTSNENHQTQQVQVHGQIVMVSLILCGSSLLIHAVHQCHSYLQLLLEKLLELAQGFRPHAIRHGWIRCTWKTWKRYDRYFFQVFESLDVFGVDWWNGWGKNHKTPARKQQSPEELQEDIV